MGFQRIILNQPVVGALLDMNLVVGWDGFDGNLDIGNSFSAELWGMVEALSLAWSLGFR